MIPNRQYRPCIDCVFVNYDEYDDDCKIEQNVVNRPKHYAKNLPRTDISIKNDWPCKYHITPDELKQCMDKKYGGVDDGEGLGFA